MTTINNQDDFLNALSDNSQWREAVRAKILGDELLQLPARFDALTDRIDLFVAEQQETNRELRESNLEQKEINRELREANQRHDASLEELSEENRRRDAFLEELREMNRELREDNRRRDASFEGLREEHREQQEVNRRLNSSIEELRETTRGLHSSIDRLDETSKGLMESAVALRRQVQIMSDDVGKVKGHYARDVVIDDAAGVAQDIGLQYVRILTKAELTEMAQRAAGRVPTNELRSFRRADLVIEATDGNDTHYIAVEVSFTADERETTRALRNARLLAEFTNHPAYAAVASVRNDQSVADQVDAGEIYWHPIDENELEPD